MGLAALFFCGFGWGQPVQINPFNFKHRRRDELFVALAGVVMNLLLAAAFVVIAKIVVMAGSNWIMNTTLGMGVWQIILYAIQINLVLMIFNLIPCPPLDGFNIIANIVGFAGSETYWRIYRYGSWILVLIIITGITGMVISPCVQFLMNIAWQFII